MGWVWDGGARGVWEAGGARGVWEARGFIYIGRPNLTLSTRETEIA